MIFCRYSVSIIDEGVCGDRYFVGSSAGNEKCDDFYVKEFIIFYICFVVMCCFEKWFLGARLLLDWDDAFSESSSNLNWTFAFFF